MCVRACVRGGGGTGWRGHLSGVAVHPCLLGGVRPPFGGRRWGVLDVQPPPQLVHRRLPLALEVDVQQEAASSADPRRPPDVLAAEQGAVPVTNTQHTHYNNISNRGESHKLKNIERGFYRQCRASARTSRSEKITCSQVTPASGATLRLDQK